VDSGGGKRLWDAWSDRWESARKPVKWVRQEDENLNGTRFEWKSSWLLLLVVVSCCVFVLLSRKSLLLFGHYPDVGIWSFSISNLWDVFCHCDKASLFFQNLLSKSLASFENHFSNYCL
jgi:hypothetical protein